ncbi:sigma-70 family RNA polymerase sigma factor [Mycobacterium haemophilum]
MNQDNLLGSANERGCGVPDLGALYLCYADTMHKVAASVLREAGLTSQMQDVVQDVIVSIMTSPPANVGNWEAFLVIAVKRKALDRINSAHVRHAGNASIESVEDQADDEIDVAEDVAAELDRKQRAAVAWDCLSILDDRDRRVLRDVVVRERPGTEVAKEHGLSPGRISQIVTGALTRLRDEMMRREGGDEQ